PNYAFNVVVASVKARLQSAGLFYDRKFDCSPPDPLPYLPKFDYTSPHSLAFDRIRPRTRVLDVGCAGGYMGAYLMREKQCQVDGIDSFPAAEPEPGGVRLSAFYLHNLNAGLPALDFERYDYVLMLDVV